MSENIEKSTEDLKKKFARSYHNDGLLDIFVGWAIVSVGLFMETSATIFSFLGWMPILFVAPLKNRIVLPRWGYAKFKKPSSIPMTVLVGAGIVLVIGALLFAFVLEDFKGLGSPITVAVLGLSLIMLLATGINRKTIYAIFIPLFFIVGLGLKILTPTLVMFVGAVLMLIGISLLVIFLRKYPVLVESK